MKNLKRITAESTRATIFCIFGAIGGTFTSSAMADAAADAATATNAAASANKSAAEANSALKSIQSTLSSHPSDGKKYDGDKLQLLVKTCGFEEIETAAPAQGACAPKGSEIIVNSDGGAYLFVAFKEIGTDPCTPECTVKPGIQYRIARTKLQQYYAKRSGVVFGALVVPFKFRLGSKHELVSSATVAPYVGWAKQSGWGGLTYTPVFSAGLGMVPVTDATSNSTVTKAAWSIAGGFLLTSSKNEQFTAGLLFGKDFLNAVDRKNDPSVEKPWASLFAGYSF
ncbi:hypothetical protein ACU6VI_12665 [Sphaerotilus natans]|uniref:hypothetical protein n=1 Tax=Sphaerotilus natans TaxID=34103 RepID=UPI00406D23B1